ncbi:MAG: MerR family transcriptional regulator [Myxococcales bacterium]|nr:MerR family transcriptional regulator [Myxococcales bacterium]
MALQRDVDPAHPTTDDVMAAAGVARRTVQVWVERGLLPAPRRVVIAGVVFTRFPAWAIERARFVVKQRAEGLSTAEVRSMLDMMGVR